MPNNDSSKHNETQADNPCPKSNAYKRQFASKYARKAKVCFAVAIVGSVLLILLCLVIKRSAPWAIFPFLLFMGIMAMGFYYQKQEMKLRCTRRTTAVCINTILHSTGRTPSRHPIVEYEVEGVKYTAELSISCTRGAVGEIYTIYYDPLEPTTVRA